MVARCRVVPPRRGAALSPQLGPRGRRLPLGQDPIWRVRRYLIREVWRNATPMVVLVTAGVLGLGAFEIWLFWMLRERNDHRRRETGEAAAMKSGTKTR